MALLYINARCKQLLNILLAQTDYISLNRLAEALNVSRRTVYYDIEKVNIWLEQAKLPRLEVVREKGLFLSHQEREAIQELLEQDTKHQVYIFSPEERAKIIICYVIYAPEQIYLEQLTECFEVSRNTIFTDLKEVTKLLGQYDLKLEYQPKQGYDVTGDTVRIRALFVLYFNELFSLFDSGAIKFFHQEQIQDYYHKLTKIEEELGINYVEGVLRSIAALIPLLYQHRRSIEFTGLKQAEIMKTREYALAQKYFSDLEPVEQMYLSLHLLGSRVNLVPDEFFESDSKASVYDLTKALISEFERVACVSFDKREELERALFVHLNTSLYRYRYGIQIGNLLGDDVMNEYPDLFAITKIAVERLERQIGIPIPDSEIAYLTLHFGGFLKIADSENDHLRILIVCVNGISTGNMIKREVHKLLPFAEIVDVVAAVDLLNAQDICDLIISTVKINSVVPSITVHPILTEFDRKSILSHKLVAPKNVEIQRNRLFQVVKKYVNPKDYENLLKDLTAYVQGDIQKIETDMEAECNLLSLLDESRIRIFPDECFWQTSIRIAGQCLLNNRSIEKRYIETIITQLQYYGPYMFLTEDVILAHAKPEDGVNCLDFSIAVFKTPVAFSEYRKAKLVLMLAAEDQEKHLHILQDILTLIGEPETVDSLAACDTKDELLTLIRQKLA
ncbi:MAG: PRD domain-containing protein [Eubacteriales bacterium]|nr:PRD domain-containing protein [Eubacteriales bacterium]